MVELGYTQAVDIKLIADSQDNRKGHYGEDNNIYLNDANFNNTKDLATTLGHVLLLISFWFLCLSAGVLPKLLLLVSAKLPSP
jgi:hypothetical protein